MEKISNTVEIVKSLPDYAPIPKTALGPALNEQGYYVDALRGTYIGLLTVSTSRRF